MINPTTAKIFELRKDMSDYVFHFTKWADGKKTFQSIIEQRKIKDMGQKGFICFTEAPLPSLVDLFDFFNEYSKPMYCPYGIGIRKELFFAMGGRPVFYGTEEEVEQLKSIGFGWRALRYEPESYDFSWLREWRIRKPEIELTYDNCIAVVPSVKEMEELTMDLEDIDVDAEPDDGGYVAHWYGTMRRIFKCVDFECIRAIEKMGRSELETVLSECKEIEDIYLGSSCG